MEGGWITWTVYKAWEVCPSDSKQDGHCVASVAVPAWATTEHRTTAGLQQGSGFACPQEGGDTVAMDVHILVPVRGPLEWLQLATGVSEEAYEVIKRVTKWGTKCAPCAGPGQRTATAIPVIDA